MTDKAAYKPVDDFTTAKRLCDDDSYVSQEPVDPQPVDGLTLTYLDQHNRFAAWTGHAPVEEPFSCTGSAHLAGEHIRCTSPAHRRCKHDTPGALDTPSLCWRCLTEAAADGPTHA